MKKYYDEITYANKGNNELLSIIKETSIEILDVGCGEGANIEILKNQGKNVIGLTISQAEFELLKKKGLNSIMFDITNQNLPFEENRFDCIIFSHILEHIAWPSEILIKYKKMLKKDGQILIALPNISVFKQRIKFLLGNFEYTEDGLMDNSHLRFYNYYSSKKIFDKTGLKIDNIFGVGQVPLGLIRKILPSFSKRIDTYFSKKFPNLFAFQIVISTSLIQNDVY